MTQHLIDIASYQRGINLDTVVAAGFTLANVKTSQGTHYTFSDARMYANQAKARGMGVSLFHWLEGTASGAAQAAYCWRTAGPIVADVGPVAFQVDNEAASGQEATWAITRDFVNAIADRLGHLPFMYTGDWWATAGGRAAWNVASLTPWLMAAPNNGYTGTYPGDASAQWKAGYWGYKELSLMQYAVEPIAGAGGGNISKAAIRDPGLWTALTGGDMEQNELIKGYKARAVSVGDGFADQGNLRDWWYTVAPATSNNPPPKGSRADVVFTAASVLPAQMAALNEKIDAIEAGAVPPEVLSAALLQALQDPAVVAVLTAISKRGADLAEDS